VSELDQQLIINSIATGSVYALVSLGLCLTYGLLRIFNFAHGQVLAVGAYCYYVLRVHEHAPFQHSLFLTMLGASLLLVFISYAILSAFIFPFLQRSSSLVLVSTLALGTMMESLLAMGFGLNVRSLAFGTEEEAYRIFSAVVTLPQLLSFGFAVIVIGVFALVVHGTPFGRRVRAVSLNRNSALSLGVDVRRLTSILFLVSTLIAGFTGILVGMVSNIQPSMGSSFTMKGFAAMALGGLGNIWGTVVGSYLLGFLENFSIGRSLFGASIPSGYRDSFAYLTILLVLLFRPQGLFAKERRTL
jgi:branched-subunit amino acid ABC-type transport system permease component